jgi:Cation transporter/ATPase, N-terminus
MTEAAPPVSSARSQRPALDLAAAARHPVDAVLHELGSTQTGLTSDQAARRLATVGRNVLASHKVTALGVLGRQLRNPLLILLLAAAGVSAATGDPTDGAIIAAIVVLSVGLGDDACSHLPRQQRRTFPLTAEMEPEVGFEPTTFRLRDGCSASVWTAPDGSSLLTLDGQSVQTAPVGSRTIVWMIIGMIKAHPTKNRMARRAEGRGLTVCGEAATLGALGPARYG